MAKPIGGCALLGTANAARILGGPVAIATEENQKTPLGLIRSCTYSGAGIELPYRVTTYPSAAVAKQILSIISEKRQEPRDGSMLVGFGNPKVKGYPSVVDYLQLIPLPDEPPPQSDFSARSSSAKAQCCS